MTLPYRANAKVRYYSSPMKNYFAPSDSVSGVCRNCGHKARNHFAERSPLTKRCLEKDCKCDWAWDGKNETNPVDQRRIGGLGQAETIERYRGCLLGLAIADAVGATVEFRAPGSFKPLEDMVGGGPFGLQPGQWTDDTSMALCLAESLIKCSGFDPADQLARYLRYWKEGYLSSTGSCFDIGGTIRRALVEFEHTHKPYCGPRDPSTAGNGSLMRLAPVALFYAQRPGDAIGRCGDSSRTTHGAKACVDACRYFGALLVGAVKGASKDELLAERYTPVPGYWLEEPLVQEVDDVARGSFKHRQPPEIQGSGYVVKSLEAALWAFLHSCSFRDGCLLVVNLGDDADTTGAIYGQLAGAFYGKLGLPMSWCSKLTHRELIESFADELFNLSRMQWQ